MAGLMGEALGDAYVNIMAETSALQAGLFQAKAMTMAFSQSAGIGISRALTAAMIGIPMVIGGAMVYSIKKFMEAEVVSNKLASAISMVGDNANISMPALTKLADAIAMKTKWDDEDVKSAMASAAALGFHTKQIKEAMPAVVGLAARLNMDLGGAMRLTVRASQGHTQMLQRYGLQLGKNMTTEQKYQAVLKYGRAGTGIAVAETNTLSGAFGQMRKSISEVAESFGTGLMQSGAFTSGIQTMTAWIWSLKDNIDKFVADGTFASWMDSVVGGVRYMYSQLRAGFQLVWSIVKELHANVTSIMAAIGLSLWEPMVYAADAVYNAWKNTTDWLGGALAALWEKIKDPSSKLEMPKWEGLLTGMTKTWDEVTAVVKGGWGDVVDTMTSEEIFSEWDRIANQYRQTNKSIADSLGVTKATAYPKGPPKGAGAGGMADKASVSIISLADIWKKMQEDVVKKRADDKKIDLAQKQLNTQEQTTAYLRQIVGKQNIGVGLMHPIYGVA